MPRLRTHLTFCLIATVLLMAGPLHGEPNPADRDRIASHQPPRVAPIRPLAGNAWIEEDGIRAAWYKYSICTDEMIDALAAARVNTIFMKSAFQDLLDMPTARWVDGKIAVEPRPTTLNKMIDATERATAQGIHVLWLASYELNTILADLKRLGYQQAFVEGPTRFVPPGIKNDVAALDPTFWRGITGAYGDLVAKLSLKYPIEGILFDTEHYDGGIMYLQGCGFADVSFKPYLKLRGIDKTVDDLPPGTRYEYLKNHGLLLDYHHYLEECAYEQGRYLAERWRAVNPHLMAGIWPLLDSWFSRGLLRGFGGAPPALGLSGVEYYWGSDQSAAMADYFESHNRNLRYMAGFLPSVAYTPDQLGDHTAQAIRKVGGYWLLSPQEQLRQVVYQQALCRAFEQGCMPVDGDRPPVELDYQVASNGSEPVLVVTAGAPAEAFSAPPLLTLRSTLSGTALCDRVAMEVSAEDKYVAKIPLVRRLGNNLCMDRGYRSGVMYRCVPVPHEMLYEDPHHTKLFDGRAYGYFGTTVAWSPEVEQAEVVFDLHQPYHITKVELSQPQKLEDRNGGPSLVELDLAIQPDQWIKSVPLESHFSIKNFRDDDAPESFIQDKRHQRSWLAWVADKIDQPARWMRLRLQRVRPNSCLSLGEVVIWGRFSGDLQAALQAGGRQLLVGEGRRYRVEMK